MDQIPHIFIGINMVITGSVILPTTWIMEVKPYIPIIIFNKIGEIGQVAELVDATIIKCFL